MFDMKCRKGFDVLPLKSAAGWYIGTLDDKGMPNCRISDYVGSEDECMFSSMNRQTSCIENSACNGGVGCFET